jgi:hypothetical protein
MPELKVVAILAAHVGVPFLVLSASGPLVQAWSIEAFPDGTVFRLFAVSNAGSLAALLTYPFVVEPLMALSTQALVWKTAFTLFIVLLAWLGFTRHAEAPARNESPSDGAPPPAWQWAVWLGLSACGSTMLLAATNRMSLDVPATPFLWVIPLAVYLITFMITFAAERYYSRRVWLSALPLAALISLMLSQEGMLRGGIIPISFHSVTLLVCCMCCHGELARLKPASSHLTGYYLFIAGGGAIGGAFVSLLAPLIFSDYFELHIAWVTTFAVTLVVLYRDRRSRFHAGRPRAVWIMFGLGLLTIAGLAIHASLRHAGELVHRERSFHGVVRVDRKELRVGDEYMAALRIRHNGIVHGVQLQDPSYSTIPTAYYGPTGGLGRAFTVLRSRRKPDGTRDPMRVAAIGLGAGMLAAHGEAGDYFHFYEIDPVVERLARQHFTFLSGTPATTDVILGDGRLSMERELETGEQHTFDIVVIDAFSGDAVPLHLLTLEAFAVYRRHLKPGGVLALHVSSHFLDLVPLVAGLAAKTDLFIAWVSEEHPAGGILSSSSWVLVSDDDQFLSDQMISGATSPLPPESEWLVFTDERSSLVDLIAGPDSTSTGRGAR